MKLQMLALAIFPLGALLRFAQTPEKPASRLDDLPQPWKEPIHHISSHLRVPYRSPKLLDVSGNGHSLKPSSTDGYEAWYADGYTQVQINVPPLKTKTMDLYGVTCAYNGNEKRSYGWKPPEAVMSQLKSGNKP